MLLKTKDVNTVDVLYFRRALAFINDSLPFSPAFGKAATREQCIQSAQRIFDAITGNSRRHVLDFKALCQIAEEDDGSYDKQKIKFLIKVFRPNRLGEITKMDFIQSIDR